ncbi:MAG: nitroreductase [Polyangiaceae bacterium]|nr:nitroreductase [Polyangiaceae bacterium]
MTDLTTVLESRRSVRAFLPRDVPRETLRGIFERAQRAPSWCNIQPWRVYVASGEIRERFVAAMLAAAKGRGPEPEFPYAAEYPEPYSAHRRACGKALYEAMGVARDDGEARRRAWLRNFVAFDAPHVAIIGIDRRFDLWAAIDVGCWLQSVMLLAQAEGVATCSQASLGAYPGIAREHLGIPETIKVMFGLALGYEDPDAAANKCRTTREPVDANVTFSG